MIIARALALGGLALGVDVDRPIVHLDLHHGVRVLPVAFVAGAGSAGARREPGFPLATRAHLAVGRALVALAAEADQIALAGEVAVLAVHDDVAVTSAELADRALAVCVQIDGLARRVATGDPRASSPDRSERQYPTAAIASGNRAKRQRKCEYKQRRNHRGKCAECVREMELCGKMLHVVFEYRQEKRAEILLQSVLNLFYEHLTTLNNNVQYRNKIKMDKNRMRTQGFQQGFVAK